MKTSILKILTIFPFICLGFVYAQSYNMSNSSVTTCSGTFYDSGGSGSNYSINELYTFTICPSTPGYKVSVNFTTFNIEDSWDFLTVYDGTSTSAPSLGTYTGTTGPGLASATPSNSSGCLTFVFDSDGGTNFPGWIGTIACTAPCQSIISNIVSTSPSASAGIVNVCQGTNVSFVGSGTFSSSSAGATYTWYFGDGTTGSGTNVSHTYAVAGAYQVNLVITDASGCVSQNSASVVVRVSTAPTIVTAVAPNPICLGQSANLTANVTMNPYIPNCTPPVSGTTFLPDGSGVSYTTSINVNCFNIGQTVTAASNFNNICLNLEHSYLGDLNIRLICPNGQSMVLKAYPGGNGTYLGSPFDDPTVGPGTGSTYCFTPTATTLLVNGPLTPSGSPSGNSIQAGNYKPVQPFTNLIGCPLNGNWTIEVTDNLASDNGYIFNWDVNFSVAPATGSFTPTIASQGWVASPTLTSTGTTTATVTPTVIGTPCFTYSVTDNFGCTYTQNQCLTVGSNVPISAGPDVTICTGSSTTLTGTNATTYSWSTGATTASITVSPTSTTTYTVTGTSSGGCITSDQVTVTVLPPPIVNAGSDVTVCSGGSTTLTATGATTYSWSPATNLNTTSGAIVISTPVATITYTVTGTNGSCTSTDQVTVTVGPPPPVNAGIDQTVCAGTAVTLTATGATTYSWDNGVTNGVVFTPLTTTTYTVTGTTSSCISTDQVTVTVNPLATANANIDQSVCAGGTITLAGSVGGSATSGTWSASSGSFSNASSLTSTYTPSLTSGTVTLTLTTNDPAGPCSAVTDQIVVTINPLPIVNAGPDQTVCGSVPVTLTATGADSYSWTGGITNGVAFTPASTTTYTVTGTTTATGCTNTDAVTITVNTSSTVDAGPDQTVCGNVSVTLSGSGALTYSWTGGVTNGVAFTPTSTTTYTVTGTFAGGCTDTDDVTVTVNPLPIIVANDVSVCSGVPVTLSASGANTYSWSPGTFLNTTSGSIVTFTGTATTSYTVSGTSASGCIGTDIITVSVTSNAPINAGTDVSVCSGVSTVLSATGGITYTWDNSLGSGNNFSVSPTSTTTYTVIGTDAGGCIGTDAITVTVNPLPTVNAGTDQTICAGSPVTLSGSGASNYTWDNGVTNGVTFYPVTTTTYTVSGTDVNGCVDTDQVVVNVNPIPVVNAGPDQSVCTGQSVTLSGSGAISYSWTGGVIDGIPFVPLSTTTYTVTGTAVGGCTGTDQVTITVGGSATINAGNDQSVCSGTSVTLIATGATSYTWDNGVVNGIPFIPVSTNTYTVSGTTASGCTGTDQVTITVNPLPIVDAGPDQTVCSGQSVTLTGSGASTYTWDNGVINGTAFTPAATNTYTVSGTDVNGCVNTDQVTVTVGGSATIDAGQDQTVCSGTSVTLTATGATTYTWDNGVVNGVPFTPSSTTTYTVTGTISGCIGTDQVVVTVNPNPTPVINGPSSYCTGNFALLSTSIPYSTYEWSTGATTATINATEADNPITVTVTNEFGCSGTSPVFTVTENSVIIADFTIEICEGESALIHGVNQTTAGIYSQTFTTGGCDSISNVTLVVNPLPIVDAGPDQTVCSGQSVTLTGSGASTYTWDNGVTNGISFTPSATNTYTVSGTDVNGCVNTDQVTVTVGGSATIDAGPDQTVCSGTSVTLTATGATTYSWDNGVVNGVPFTPSSTTTYTVTGTIAGCIGTDQVLVTVNPNPTPVINGSSSYCTGNFALLSTSIPYSIYDWSTGATTATINATEADNPITVTVTNEFGCIGTSPTFTVTENTVIIADFTIEICEGESALIHGISQTTAGIYSQTFTTGGCDSISNVTLVVNPLPIVDAGPDQTVCSGQPVTLNGSGASTYTWDNGVTNGTAFTPVSTNTYTVSGTDVNGCVNTDQVTVTVGGSATIDAGPDQTVCSGTSVTLTATGATTYTWDNGVLNGVPFTPSSTTTYTVTGTIAGCIGTDQVVVTVNPNPTPVINGPSSYCTGNFALLSTSIPYSTYDWSTGATTATINATEADNPITVTVTNEYGCSGISPTFTVIENSVIIADFTIEICEGESAIIHGITQTTAGIYSQTFTTGGCDSISNVTLIVNPLPNVNAGVDQTVCAGQSVTLTGSGASTYTWDNGVTNGISFTPTATNTYSVSGTDVNGCVNTDQVTVTVGGSATIDAGQDQIVCSGISVTLTATGATTYTWDNGVVNGVPFTPSSTTTYTVTGTTASGCVGSDQVTVTVNPLPAVNGGPDQSICIGGSVTLTASGANTFTWNNSVVNNVSFIPVATSTYTVTGTSATGCVNTDQVIVTVNPLPIVNAGVDQAVCSGSTTTLSGTGASTYTWNYGVINNVSFTPVLTNTYTVIGTDVNGCVNTDQVIVTVNSVPNVGAGVDQIICAGEIVTLSGSGANAYSWDNGVLNGIAFSPSTTTTYTVTGTSLSGCISTDQVIITVNSLPLINAGLDQSVCVGSSVILTATGANSYSWNPAVTNGVPFTPQIGTVSYTVTGTAVSGCINSDQVVVNVNPLPSVNAGSDLAVCVGDQVILNGSGALTYSWNNGISDGVAFIPQSTLSYIVTGTSSAGCINTDEVLVSVNPIPIVFAGNDFSICDGQSAFLNGSGASTYNWDNEVINGVAFQPPLGTTTYTVIGSTNAGCENTDQINITVNALPVVSFTADITSGCSPLEVTFTNTTPNSTNCVWTINDETTLLGCTNVTNVFDEEGCYSIALTTTSSNGCININTEENFICVDNPPVAAFTPSDYEISKTDSQIEFDNNSTGASNYIWDFGDNSGSFQENPSHDYSNDNTGNYIITLIAISPLGCTDTTQTTIQMSEEVIFYVPNTFTPNFDNFNQTFKPILTSGFDPYDYSLFIYDRWGELIFESHNSEIGWDGSYGSKHETEMVQEGVYTWKIEFQTTATGERIIELGHVNLLK